MGFDGKSIINPRQINIVHEIFTPTQKDIIFAEKVVKEIDEKKALGIGVFTVDGKMIDMHSMTAQRGPSNLPRHQAYIRGICKMINAVGRDIPEEILEMTGKEVFQGNHYRDGYVYKKDGPYTKCVANNTQSKLVANIHDVLVKCGIKDGMTLGFHHHFREGDYIVNMVMEEVHKMGIKDITICASSLGKAHDPIVLISKTEPLPISSPPVSAVRSVKQSLQVN